MKTIFISLLLCLGSVSVSAQKQSFTLKAEIEGMQKGDTVYIYRENVLEPSDRTVDVVLAKKKNGFEYKKKNDGASFYTLEYHPIDTAVSARNREMLLFLGKGTVKLKGTADRFNLAEKSGAEYENSLVARYTFLKDSVGRVEADVYDKYDKARKDKNSAAMKEVLVEFTQVNNGPDWDKVSMQLANESTDTEYGAALYLWNSSLLSSAEMEKRLSEMDSEIQKTYTADLIRQVIDMKKKTEPGAVAPDFTLYVNDTTHVSLSDYKGKYLLLFYWGPSVGSYRINPEIEKIYYTYHSKGLEILDLVQNSVDPDALMTYKPEVYRQLSPMLHHIWKTVYTSYPDNAYIAERYNLTAMPLLILISPEGKIIARNFGNYGEIIQKLERAMSK